MHIKLRTVLFIAVMLALTACSGNRITQVSITPTITANSIVVGKSTSIVFTLSAPISTNETATITGSTPSLDSSVTFTPSNGQCVISAGQTSCTIQINTTLATVPGQYTLNLSLSNTNPHVTLVSSTVGLEITAASVGITMPVQAIALGGEKTLTVQVGASVAQHKVSSRVPLDATTLNIEDTTSGTKLSFVSNTCTLTDTQECRFTVLDEGASVGEHTLLVSDPNGTIESAIIQVMVLPEILEGGSLATLVSANDGKAVLAFSSGTVLYYSLDSGQTWHYKDAPDGATGVGEPQLLLNTINGQVVIAANYSDRDTGSVNGVMYTVDASSGSSWLTEPVPIDGAIVGTPQLLLNTVTGKVAIAAGYSNRLEAIQPGVMYTVDASLGSDGWQMPESVPSDTVSVSTPQLLLNTKTNKVVIVASYGSGLDGVGIMYTLDASSGRSGWQIKSDPDNVTSLGIPQLLFNTNTSQVVIAASYGGSEDGIQYTVTSGNSWSTEPVPAQATSVGDSPQLLLNTVNGHVVIATSYSDGGTGSVNGVMYTLEASSDNSWSTDSAPSRAIVGIPQLLLNTSSNGQAKVAIAASYNNSDNGVYGVIYTLDASSSNNWLTEPTPNRASTPQLLLDTVNGQVVIAAGYANGTIGSPLTDLSSDAGGVRYTLNASSNTWLTEPIPANEPFIVPPQLLLNTGNGHVVIAESYSSSADNVAGIIYTADAASDNSWSSRTAPTGGIGITTSQLLLNPNTNQVLIAASYSSSSVNGILWTKDASSNVWFTLP
ncbi:MAG: hypothetical protein AAGA27_01390 [Pseudomonadota bacterium]